MAISDALPGRRAEASAARVAAILTAAEETAARIRAEAEQGLEARIAEGDRAAINRVRAAEEEAAEILREARREAHAMREATRVECERARQAATGEALEIVARAEEDAGRTRGEAEAEAQRALRAAQDRARDLLADARVIAAAIKADGLELTEQLRELSASMKTNAARLVRDVVATHGALMAQLDRLDGGARPSRRDNGHSESFGDIPEFIPGER